MHQTIRANSRQGGGGGHVYQGYVVGLWASTREGEETCKKKNMFFIFLFPMPACVPTSVPFVLISISL